LFNVANFLGINHLPHLCDPPTYFRHDALDTGVTGIHKEQFC